MDLSNCFFDEDPSASPCYSATLPVAGSKRSHDPVQISSKHIKLNCGTTVQVQQPELPELPDPAPIRIQVQPRQESIGLYSGVTKALFCVTVSTPSIPSIPGGSVCGHSVDSSDYLMKNQHIIVVKIQSSSQIRKVLHSRADRRSDQVVLVPVIVEKNDHHEDILVQVVDLPRDLHIKVSAKIMNSSPGVGSGGSKIAPTKCTIQRPKSKVVAKDSPYVLAQLLLYAAKRVLKDFRSQDLENLHRNKKGRVNEVLRMIQNAPATVQSLPEVKELEAKLKK